LDVLEARSLGSVKVKTRSSDFRKLLGVFLLIPSALEVYLRTGKPLKAYTH
jgi:hypothetical protein